MLTGMASALAGVGSQSAGAGQVQVCFFDNRLSREVRDRAVVELIGGYRQTIDAILAPIGASGAAPRQ